jgi:hypothetical protein
MNSILRPASSFHLPDPPGLVLAAIMVALIWLAAVLIAPLAAANLQNNPAQASDSSVANATGRNGTWADYWVDVGNAAGTL